MTTYLLVHPERFPTNDDEVIGPYLPWETPVGDLDEWYGEQVGSKAAACGRRVALLDEYGFEDIEDGGGLLKGVGEEGWELAPCEPVEVGRVVRRLFKESEGTVIVGGFARHDCVARAVKALKKLGLEVELDQVGVLPLSIAGAEAYLEHSCATTSPSL